MKLLITGGRAKRNNKLSSMSSECESGVMLIYDFTKREVVDEFEYITPIDYKATDESSVLFKSCDIDGELVYLTTKTEVITYNWKEMRVVEHYSHALMNDVHHALMYNGDLHVVSTGLDSILIKEKGGRVQLRYLSGGRPEDKFDLDKDYRKVESLKPHAVHPNFTFVYREDLHVTRFQQKDCINLVSGESYMISDNHIHDGEVLEGSLYFTSVNGTVIKTNLKDEREVYDLNSIDGSKGPLGWCRGILPVSQDKFFVGFSILRGTKIRENVKWAYSKINKKTKFSKMRTRLCLYDIKERKNESVVYLDELGVDAVFSVKLLSK